MGFLRRGTRGTRIGNFLQRIKNRFSSAIHGVPYRSISASAGNIFRFGAGMTPAQIRQATKVSGLNVARPSSTNSNNTVLRAISSPAGTYPITPGTNTPSNTPVSPDNISGINTPVTNQIINTGSGTVTPGTTDASGVKTDPLIQSKTLNNTSFRTTGNASSSNASSTGLGSSGTGVKSIQEILNGSGILSASDKLKEDGIFGKKTDRAVRLYQKANNLVVDGLVGPKTTVALSNTRKSIFPTETPNNNITADSTNAVNTEQSAVDTANGLTDLTTNLTQASDQMQTFLDQERADLLDRLKSQTQAINTSFNQQANQLKGQQKSETASFNADLVRLGGYLGPSISHTSALINLNQAHRDEVSALYAKRDIAIQNAQSAISEKDFALAKEKIMESKDLQKQVLDMHNRYIDQTLAIKREARLEAEAKRQEEDRYLTSTSKDYAFGVSTGAIDPSVTSFTDYQQQISKMNRAPSKNGTGIPASEGFPDFKTESKVREDVSNYVFSIVRPAIEKNPENVNAILDTAFNDIRLRHGSNEISDDALNRLLGRTPVGESDITQEVTLPGEPTNEPFTGSDIIQQGKTERRAKRQQEKKKRQLESKLTGQRNKLEIEKTKISLSGLGKEEKRKRKDEIDKAIAEIEQRLKNLRGE